MLEALGGWGATAPSILNIVNSGAAAPQLGAGLSFFDIKINEVAPSDVQGMDAGHIMSILHNLDVSGVSDAAAAHEALGDKLQHVADRLVQNAHTLSQSWKGAAAQAAMNKFQQMHTQTAQLAAQAKQTGAVLHWTAGVMQQFKNLPAPHGMSTVQADEHTGASIGGAVGGAPGAVIGDGLGAAAGMIGIGGDGGKAKADAQAQKYLHALNQHLVSANNALPQTVGQGPGAGHLGGNTGLGPAQMGGGTSGGGVASGPGLSPYSGGGVPGAGSAGPAHIGKFNPGQLGSGQPSASLQHVISPTGGGTGTLTPPSSPVTGGPGVPTSTPTMVPGGPVPGVGGEPTLPAEGAPTGESLTGAAADGAPIDGAAADGAAGEGAAAGGVGAEGMPPMSGMGAAGQASEVAAGESLLGTETNPAFADAAAGSGATGAIGDEEFGAAEGEGMFPMTGGASAGQQDRERRRQSWMNQNDDIWGVPRDNVGSVIEGR